MLRFKICTTPFNLSYVPASYSRCTTNYVNLAKNKFTRKQNLGCLLAEIDRRYESLYRSGMIGSNEYLLRLDIVTVFAYFDDASSPPFPIAEFLSSAFEHRRTGERCAGPIGFNFSSYIRDYDFNILLPSLLKVRGLKSKMNTFGQLHGLLFRMMFRDFWAEGGILDIPCIFALSVSTNNTYDAQEFTHRILGQQYQKLGPSSLTDRYFGCMGLEVSYFQPPGTQAPLAFYYKLGDLLNRPGRDLVALVAVMETFQRIYRPEIYAACKAANGRFTSSLTNNNFLPPSIHYDRLERDQILGPLQAKLAWNKFLKPNLKRLVQFLDKCQDLEVDERISVDAVKEGLEVAKLLGETTK